MIVDKISLKNFRKYEEFEVEFNNRLTVVVGKNGTGKTSIIDAVSKLLSVLYRQLMEYKTDSISIKDARIKDHVRHTPVLLKISGESQTFNISYSYFLKHNGSRNSYSLSEIAKLYNEKLMNDGENTILPIVCSYGAARMWNAEGIYDLTKTVALRTNGYRNSINAHLATKDLTTWFNQMTLIELQEGKPNALLSAVTEVIKKCFDKLMNYQDTLVKCNIVEHEIEFTFNNNSLYMSQLSDGYRCAITLFADIAYRMAILNPHLGSKVTDDTDGIVLIDEIDLHLHPEWQQKILGVLTEVFPKVQFIVTTHAPAVINSVKSDSLIILEGDEARKPYGEVYGKDVNTIISGVMGSVERPESVKNLFKDFYKAIDENNYQKSTEILSAIEKEIGNDDTELAGCRVKLDLLSFTHNTNN